MPVATRRFRYTSHLTAADERCTPAVPACRQDAGSGDPLGRRPDHRADQAKEES